MKKPYILTVALALIVMAAFLASAHPNRHTSDTTTTTTNQNSSGVVVLDQSGKGLTQVSASIYNRTDTTTLLLSNNSIQTLPSQLGKMTSVTVLKIDHNLLKGNVIGEIRQMSQLKSLDASYNNMTGMPAELGQLRSLETLNYSNNKITGLPNELAQLKGNLKEFNLSGNPLSSEQISTLQTELPNTKIIF